ncbi:MAG: aminoglycoside phosphotransferase family protein [Bacteroidota bacterium]
MEQIIRSILHQALGADIHTIQEIIGLGIVNQVFDIQSSRGDYILRLNEESNKLIEYKKERWCLQQVRQLGIPSADVYGLGVYEERPFMIQQKLPGVNGKECSRAEQARIWKQLGSYAAQFCQIHQVDDPEVEKNVLHRSWKQRLLYNLGEFHDKDRLLRKGIFSRKEYVQAEAALSILLASNFRSGLTHGDLCPRNVLVHGDTIYLLDWGTAEINIAPHSEIGILSLSEEASREAFHLFLEGYGLSPAAYQEIEKELRLINFLHRLDKYRWAEDRDIPTIHEYELKVRQTFEAIEGVG